ncbi:MAG: leucyl aminopeptidase family protein [Planctomycetota bacterium]|jgi:leucyl aminopeptidase
MYRSIRVGTSRSPVTVVGVFAGQSRLPAGAAADPADRRAFAEALRAPGFRADAGECVPAGAGRLLVGLGPRDELDGDGLRRIGARILRRLDRMEAKAARLALHRTVPARVADAATVHRCLAEGMALAGFRVDFFDGTAADRPAARAALVLHPDDAAARKPLQRGLAVAQSANLARRLAATPPNVCRPSWLAAEARRIARSTGLSCRVIRGAEAERQGLGGLLNVGRGSRDRPCLIVLEHRPARPRRGVHLALVGKSITYDTGGYSLKPRDGMKGMKYDKCGGVAVLGAMDAIARLKLPVRVTALLPAAENMVSDDAYRPDDIITMYNGVSVEVTNTDAEGRLVLADALAWACRKVKPTAIIDVATLTGGVVVALGAWSAGLFCNDEPLRKRIEAAADATGERVWRLPLWPAHRRFMRAKHADLWNSGPKRDGHAIQGAAFLSFFVDEDLPWAHLDIAGVSDVSADEDLFVTGPTGWGVRLLTEVAEGYAAGRA